MILLGQQPFFNFKSWGKVIFLKPAATWQRQQKLLAMVSGTTDIGNPFYLPVEVTENRAIRGSERLGSAMDRVLGRITEESGVVTHLRKVAPPHKAVHDRPVLYIHTSLYIRPSVLANKSTNALLPGWICQTKRGCGRLLGGTKHIMDAI